MRESIPMNENIVVWFALGFVVGGLVGWFLSDRYSGKRYRKQIDRLCKENNELAGEKSAALTKREDALNLAEGKLDETFKSLRAEKPKLRDLASKYWTPAVDTEPNVDMNDYMAEHAHPEDDTPVQEPFVIDADTFEQEYPNSRNITVSYYTEDHVVADERDDAFLKPYDILGEHAMDILRDTKEDVIYVHNEALDTTYEVIVCHEMSFKRDVLCENDDGSPIEYNEDNDQSDEDDEDDEDE